MFINEKTKISVIIKHNPAAIEAIATINPHFEKLRNPLLRKLLASRVTIQDAAKIGNSSLSDFYSVLENIGFKTHVSEEHTDNNNIMENKIIDGIVKSGKVVQLDVCDMLSNGIDPFSDIMQALEKLETDYVLELINTFEPIPLIKILTRKGYLSSVKRERGCVKTYFLKGKIDREKQPIKGYIRKVKLEELQEVRYDFQPPFRELDVRTLEMPLPMVTILRELEDLPQGEALFVHHKKTPQYLLPELEAKGMNILISEIDADNVKLLIYR